MHSPSERVCDSILIAAILTAAFTDWRWNKIYNWLTFSGAAAGLVVRTGFEGPSGLKFSACGLLVGLAIQFIPFWLHLVKAGDVKLLMMVGTLEGWSFTCWGFLYGAAMFGILALVWLAYDGTLRASLRNVVDFLKVLGIYQTVTEPAPPASRRMLPWGIGLASGFLLAVVLKRVVGTPAMIELKIP